MKRYFLITSLISISSLFFTSGALASLGIKILNQSDNSDFVVTKMSASKGHFHGPNKDSGFTVDPNTSAIVSLTHSHNEGAGGMTISTADGCNAVLYIDYVLIYAKTATLTWKSNSCPKTLTHHQKSSLSFTVCYHPKTADCK